MTNIKITPSRTETERNSIELNELTSYIAIGINRNGSVMSHAKLVMPVLTVMHMIPPIVTEIMFAVDKAGWTERTSYDFRRQVADQMYEQLTGHPQEWITFSQAKKIMGFGRDRTRATLQDIKSKRQLDGTKLYLEDEVNELANKQCG